MELFQELCNSLAYNSRSYFQLRLTIIQLERIILPTERIEIAIAMAKEKAKLLRDLSHVRALEIEEQMEEFLCLDTPEIFIEMRQILKDTKSRIFEGTTPRVANDEISVDEIIDMFVEAGILTLQGDTPPGVEDNATVNVKRKDERTEANDELVLRLMEPPAKRRKGNTAEHRLSDGASTSGELNVEAEPSETPENDDLNAASTPSFLPTPI